jgi:hypothetical protein
MVVVGTVVVMGAIVVVGAMVVDGPGRIGGRAGLVMTGALGTGGVTDAGGWVLPLRSGGTTGGPPTQSVPKTPWPTALSSDSSITALGAPVTTASDGGEAFDDVPPAPPWGPVVVVVGPPAP